MELVSGKLKVFHEAKTTEAAVKVRMNDTSKAADPRFGRIGDLEYSHVFRKLFILIKKDPGAKFNLIVDTADAGAMEKTLTDAVKYLGAKGGFSKEEITEMTNAISVTPMAARYLK